MTPRKTDISAELLYTCSLRQDISQRRKKNHVYTTCGPGSVVGIATGYGLEGPGIESRGGEIFRTYPDWPWGPPSLLSFPGVKSGRGVTLTPHPFLVSWS